ncbi:MAG: hypothetical protein F4066_07295 [Chloroflexi bacterium]|nr:hypothetical protein [Chloroflexota bacterium]MYF80639.1 hypothetical protein [Chloroflexota bacterium]MYI04651.1 hypothetical protein [Chloroflexota bacterium]
MEDSRFGLEGKSALTIGCGEGISRSTARLLAQTMCGVTVADIDAGQAIHVVAKVDLLGEPSVSLAARSTFARDAPGSIATPRIPASPERVKRTAANG